MEQRHIKWDGRALIVLDQRFLPENEIYISCKTLEDAARAIRNMVIRGAPLIGIVAAFGVVLGFREGREKQDVFLTLSKTRPTARNLFWALERMEALWGDEKALEMEAIRIWEEDIETNKKIGDNGSRLVKDGSNILTHCNAGTLATGGYGTALGVVRSASFQGKVKMVYSCETRPYLQGARITCWELSREGIPVTLICDNMVGYIMKKGMVDLVVVGADRIAKNGDVANKIGTYTISVLAKEHGIPFYVAAPMSTWDPSLKSGDEIPIEQRSPNEVTHIGSRKIAPSGIEVLNPSFDITPAENITAYITEKGILKKEDLEGLW